MVRSSSRTVYKPRTFFSHLVAIQYSTRLTLILSGVQWSVNRLVRVGLVTLARRRKWKGLSSEPPWISFSSSLHAKHADFTAAYFPVVCPALATWLHIIQWPCEAGNRDKDAEAHKNGVTCRQSHSWEGWEPVCKSGLNWVPSLCLFFCFSPAPNYRDGYFKGLLCIHVLFIYIYQTHIHMCIFHTQNKTKKVSRVLLNYIIYFNPVTLEFLKLLREKCLGRAQCETSKQGCSGVEPVECRQSGLPTALSPDHLILGTTGKPHTELPKNNI